MHERTPCRRAAASLCRKYASTATFTWCTWLLCCTFSSVDRYYFIDMLILLWAPYNPSKAYIWVDWLSCYRQLFDSCFVAMNSISRASLLLQLNYFLILSSDLQWPNSSGPTNHLFSPFIWLPPVTIACDQRRCCSQHPLPPSHTWMDW